MVRGGWPRAETIRHRCQICQLGAGRAIGTATTSQKVVRLDTDCNCDDSFCLDRNGGALAFDGCELADCYCPDGGWLRLVRKRDLCPLESNKIQLGSISPC